MTPLLAASVTGESPLLLPPPLSFSYPTSCRLLPLLLPPSPFPPASSSHLIPPHPPSLPSSFSSLPLLSFLLPPRPRSPPPSPPSYPSLPPLTLSLYLLPLLLPLLPFLPTPPPCSNCSLKLPGNCHPSKSVAHFILFYIYTYDFEVICSTNLMKISGNFP